MHFESVFSFDVPNKYTYNIYIYIYIYTHTHTHTHTHKFALNGMTLLRKPRLYQRCSAEEEEEDIYIYIQIYFFNFLS
jgi:hypothetical protein